MAMTLTTPEHLRGGGHRRLVIAALAAALVVVAGVAAASLGDNGAATRSIAETPGASPTVSFSRAADPNDAFLPTGTFTYTIKALGAEETGPNGTVLKAATLDASNYELVVVDDHQWTERTLSGPKAGTVRALKDGVLTEYDPDGKVLLSHTYGDDLVSARQELLLGMMTSVDTGWKKAGFTAGPDRTEAAGTVRTYTGRAVEPHTEHYQTLPWKDGAAERTYDVGFLPSSGRLYSIVDRFNGVVAYQFTLTSG